LELPRIQRKAFMKWRFFFATAALVLGLTTAAHTEGQSSPPLVIAAGALTGDQFKALSPDAVIEIDGKRMTKRDFIESRTKALEQAIQKMKAMRAAAANEFETRHKAFLDAEQAKLKAANKKVDDEVARLVAADAAAHGLNWEARKKQAADLLQQAKSATPTERSTLEKQAADLLAPAAK
jgi:hypothetical protein